MNAALHIGFGWDAVAVHVLLGQYSHFVRRAKSKELALQIVIVGKAVVTAG